MNRMFAAGLLALPALVAASPTASAQYYGCGAGGAALAPGSCAHLGCGGFCFKFLSHLHHHGPLVNYGPYYGYYPFEPYGPWNSNLQYTGPRPGDHCGWLFGRCKGCGRDGWGWGRGGHIDACGECARGRSAAVLWANVRSRLLPASHKAGKLGCDSCGATAPTAGCTGCGK
jgi:hypothetical protein